MSIMQLTWILSCVLLWSVTSGNDLPSRSSTEFISGADPKLRLTNYSVCANFSSERGIEFQRMIIEGNALYIGATNHILQVNLTTFSLDEFFVTGPRDDDPGCLAPSICGNNCGQLRCTDNKNRLLIPHRNQLIVCGSLYAGTCDILTLNNVSQPYKPEPDVHKLKCLGDTSQITRQTGNLAVAAVYVDEADASKDLFYLGNKHSDVNSVDTLFPPDTNAFGAKLQFTGIDTTSSYAPDSHDRTFVTTWTTNTHNFMLWATEKGGGQSTLLRLCHKTMNEWTRSEVASDSGDSYGKTSYTETTIGCSEYTRASIAHYRFGRLYVVLENSKGQHALCSTPLSRINSHVEDARKACFNGNQTKSGFIPDGLCMTLKGVDNSWVTCGLAQDLSSYLDPIRSNEKLELRRDFLWPSGMDPPTTLAIDMFDGSSIAFFGTATGEVLKAKIGNSASTFAEKIVLDANLPVLHDVSLDEASEYIYAMSPNKVFKVKLSNCEQYETCGKCVASNDPYCGWCVLQSRCSHKSRCENSNLSVHWLKTTENPSQCPHISSISPNSLSVAEAEKLVLTFGGSALPSHAYDCEFAVGDSSLQTVPLRDFPNNPSCFSPSEAPSIPEGRDNVNVTLRIKAGTAVVATGTFNIYDCSKIPGINMGTMCGSCVASSWNCEWCMSSNTCEDSCANSVGISNREECPAVLQVLNMTVDVPVGKPRQFTLVTKNLPRSHNFDCVLDVCESTSMIRVPGSRDGDNVTCSVAANKLKCAKEDSTVVLSLKSGEYVVDTPRPKTVTVGLFNCSGALAECGLCIISHKRHPECAWCVGTETCIPHEDCSENWVTAIDSCPTPVIEWINPPNGPKNGGTEITIAGKNLGTRHEEIRRVFINANEDVNCTVLTEKYVPSKRIVCETRVATSAPSSGQVHVRTTYGNDDVISGQEFTFKEVTVTDFQPKYALLGTKLTIEGKNLDVGNSASVKISRAGNDESSSQCHDRTSNNLVCVLPTAKNPGVYSLWTSLDGFTQNMEGKIEYVQKPNITKLIGREKLVSFYSGGILVNFEMTSLLGIQTVVLNVNDGEAEEDCKVNLNTTSVTCPTPPMESLNPEHAKRSKRSVSNEDDNPSTTRKTEPTLVSAEIIINDQLRIPLSGKLNLSYTNNPVIDPLSSMPCRTPETQTPTTRQSGGSSGNSSASQLQDESESEPTVAVQLTGKYLVDAAVKDDYTILISPLEGGSESVKCIPTFLEAKILICKAPASNLRKYEGYKVQVTVQVGNLTFPLQAEYCPEGGGLSNGAIAAIITVVVVLLAIIFGLGLCIRRRASKQKKEREQIMLMLDTLENKTRETARKAYFELQLGYMTTLTDNLSDSITYLPPVSCFMRALFNDWQPDHPMLNAGKTVELAGTRTSGLDEFIRLLKNKDFLLMLVKTLEEQKHFTVKEKGQFASLLTVCLFDDMVYFTKIMMDLLSDLIQKHVGKNPKLLLRRSESVVEKMVSHWLCINLYSQCIKDQAGKPLFLLTKAIHFLVSSAPSDVVANKAVNSLNEMTLLGSEITYEVITLKASVIVNGLQSDQFEVKVVNCDTITQVKEKIIEVVYRDRPYSESPKPDDMELELVAGQGYLVLSDIDNMSHQEGSYTQINTLKYYNVPDGAAVVLTPMKPEMNGAAENGGPPAEPRKRRLYHLIHPRDKEPNGLIEEDDSGNKTKAIIGNLINQPFQEIYLTRMVKSKTTVQEYVDGVFNAILAPSPISRAVKYFFQFLDREAAKHKISDPEVVHIWKTNSLLLRYWVNILKNPEFLFDVNKTAIVDSCLNVITQAFMDACTTTNHKLGQDSPSNKLLYAKDAERYREMVAKFFENVSSEELAGEDEVNQALREVSQNYAKEFNKREAAEQLYDHLEKYRSQVQAAVDDESLSNRLNDIIVKLSPETNGHTHDASILV